jgi:hypothetical protein
MAYALAARARQRQPVVAALIRVLEQERDRARRGRHVIGDRLVAVGALDVSQSADSSSTISPSTQRLKRCVQGQPA